MTPNNTSTILSHTVLVQPQSNKALLSVSPNRFSTVLSRNAMSTVDWSVECVVECCVSCVKSKVEFSLHVLSSVANTFPSSSPAGSVSVLEASHKDSSFSSVASAWPPYGLGHSRAQCSVDPQEKHLVTLPCSSFTFSLLGRTLPFPLPPLPLLPPRPPREPLNRPRVFPR